MMVITEPEAMHEALQQASAHTWEGFRLVQLWYDADNRRLCRNGAYKPLVDVAQISKPEWRADYEVTFK